MTAPTMSPDLDKATLEGLAPPCELPPFPRRNGDSCPNAADWVGIKSCCGATRLICDGHRKALEAWWAEGLSSMCITCDSIGEDQWTFLERL